MRRLRAWASRLGGVFSGGRREQDLADELESHLQLHIDDNIRQGMTPEAARTAALIRLGGLQSITEQHRDQRSIPLLSRLRQDVQYAGRTLRRSPGFAAVALITIALGVAGPTITFTMTKAWILEPLPFADPDSLVDIRSIDRSSGDTTSVNAADFRDFQRGTSAFSELAGYRSADARLTGGDRAERIRGALVTTGFFSVLGTDAALGRVFEPADGEPSAPKLVVISSTLWRDRFHGDPDAIGRSLRLDGQDHIVIGVLPDRFHFTLQGRIDVWRPLIFTPEQITDRRPRALVAMGRLRHGRSVEEGRGQLIALADQLSKTYPDTNARRGVRVIPLADEVRFHHDLGFIVPVMFAMVGCVLLIACVNVTNVMLARTSARRQEMAIRLALGASRARLVQQWLVEHVLLFLVASAVGTALAVYGTSWITDSIPVENRQYLRNFAVLKVDRVVIAFALGTGALCGAVFGWLPAWNGASADVNADLRDGSARSTVSRAGARLRSTLVVSEVALALAVLIGAGLLVQTARNMTHADMGFDQARLLTFRLSLDAQRYVEPADIRSFMGRLTQVLAPYPGVTGAAAGTLVPFSGFGSAAELLIDGEPETKPADTPVAALNQITGGYCSVMGLRILRGRAITETDVAEAQKVALVNETLAARFLGGREALGRRLRLGRGTADVWTVVGIAADVKNYEVTDPAQPHVYIPFAQQPRRTMTVVVRTVGAPDSFAPAARAAVAAVDPAEPVSAIATMDELIRRVTGPYQTIGTFVTVLGIITLLLAGVGVYGVVSYTFAQRTREIGIRMALGATRVDIAILVLSQIRLLLGAAFVPGLALAFALGHTLKAILFGVTPTDLRLYGAMALLLAVVALLAASVPARRAARIDPMRALRCD
jgi:putative ABC transport system permease protein